MSEDVSNQFEFNWTAEGLPFTEHVTSEFLQAVIDVAQRLQINPDDLMAVMAWESWIDPANENLMGSGATGLIQFMPNTAISLGTTVEILAQMSALEQLEYVYEHLRRNGRGRMVTLSDVYMAVLWPAAVGQPGDHEIWERDCPETGNQYRWNSGLDVNQDGVITVAEATQRVIDRRDNYFARR